MSHTACVAGVGMIAFAKPGASDPYPEMGAKAARAALADAGLAYDAIEQAYVGYVYGDSTCGQRALYEVGMSGIPIVNVNNNCSTGSTALYLARQAIESGAADCVLALGMEQMRSRRDRQHVHRPADAVRPLRRGLRRARRRRTRFRWRCATSAAPGASTCSATARRWRPSRRSAPRRAATPPTIRWRSSARCSAPKTCMNDKRDLARRHDAAHGLPADLRRGRGDAGVAVVRAAATGCAPMCASRRRR